MLRRYATIATKPPSRLRARGKSPVGLDHFIQRQRALALWREIVRSTANIPEEGARKDMRQFARAEFEQQRGVTDIVRPYPVLDLIRQNAVSDDESHPRQRWYPQGRMNACF